MQLSDYVHTLGRWLSTRYGQKVHKIALNSGLSCPNRDGTKGVGGCTFCNNASFTPHTQTQLPSLASQIKQGCERIAKYQSGDKYLIYFQAYTNTYGRFSDLKAIYDQALDAWGVMGLSIGTRPDTLSPKILDLLAHYRQLGYEIWLELGLQSTFDESLNRVNRGHNFKSYIRGCQAARKRGLSVCCHLMAGLPGETHWHVMQSLDRVLQIGVDGLKIHPLHIVKDTALAQTWQQEGYQPLDLSDYIHLVADMIERTPWHVVYHRLTGTAPKDLLIAPRWCLHKWPVLNGITQELNRRKSYQGITLDGILPSLNHEITHYEIGCTQM